MSNLLSDMPFLPANAPANLIVDCSGVLPAARLSQLNLQAAQSYYKPYVVILPPNFSPTSMAQSCSNIVLQWHVPNDSFLLVINLHGHDLRIVPGPVLQRSGLTDRKITQIIATKFGPHMRNVHSANSLSAALPNAISDTMDGVNETLGHGRIGTLGTGRTTEHAGLPGTPATDNATQPGSLLTGGGLLIPAAVAVALILSFIYLKRQQQ